MDCLQQVTKHCPSIVHYMDCWFFCSTWQSTVSVLFTPCVAVSPGKTLSHYYSLYVLMYHLAKHCLNIVHYLDCCLLLQHLAKHCPKLRAVELAFCSHINRDAIYTLTKHCKDLSRVNLANTTVSDAAVTCSLATTRV